MTPHQKSSLRSDFGAGQASDPPSSAAADYDGQASDPPSSATAYYGWARH